MSVTVMGQTLAMPVYCSPTGAAAPVSPSRRARRRRSRLPNSARCSASPRSARSSLEAVRKDHAGARRSTSSISTRDRGLNRAMMQRAKQAGVEVMMLTVDSITGGNRERDLRTGFSIPFKLNLGRHAAIRDQAGLGAELSQP